MEGRGAAGVKNIARQMNYPLRSRGEKNQLEQTIAPKKKSSKRQEERQNEMLQRKRALKNIYWGV